MNINNVKVNFMWRVEYNHGEVIWYLAESIVELLNTLKLVYGEDNWHCKNIVSIRKEKVKSRQLDRKEKT